MTDTRDRAVSAVEEALFKRYSLGHLAFLCGDDTKDEAAAFLDALTPEGRRALAAELLDEETLAEALTEAQGGAYASWLRRAPIIRAALRGDA